MTRTQLKRWRLAQGYTQRAVSEQLGIQRETWSRWERGIRRVPSWLPVTLRALTIVNYTDGTTSAGPMSVGQLYRRRRAGS